MIRSLKDVVFRTANECFPSPRDWRDVFMYFLLVDRFDNNGADIPAYDPANPPGARAPDKGRVFQGGNLKGIARRLDYLKGLGVNALWLSPVFKNRMEKDDSYHGYGIQDFLEVDPRFGTRDDLRYLVWKAHAKGMYVILDIVINHTGDNWAYPGDNPYYYWKGAQGPFDFGYWRKLDSAKGYKEHDAVWPEEFRNAYWFKRRGRIGNWDDREEAVNGDFQSLKELDINRPEVLDALIKVYKHWIAFADIDGFRLDTVKHMESSATAVFCNAVREYAKRIGKQNFFLFGEIVGDDAALQEYIGRNSRIAGTNERFPSLDAALDFPLYFVLEEAIKGLAGPAVLRDRYERFKTHYADHGEAGRYFVTFADNHDQMSRPYRRFMHNNPYPDQAVLAIGYLLTSQGIPCIYYGTEQGFDGGGDHDSFVRECMFGGDWGAFNTIGQHFFDPGHSVYKRIAAIAAVRNQEPALRYGRQYFREISGNGTDFGHPLDGRCTLAWSRILDTSEVLVVMNLDSGPRSDYATVDANLCPEGMELRNLLKPSVVYRVEKRGERHAVRVELKGHEMAILRGKA